MNKTKTALITGITGQDGSYLAEFLLEKGYDVHGTIRRSSVDYRERIAHLEGKPNFHLHYADMGDSMSIMQVVSKVRPTEIYNLAAQSHVQVSFDSPEFTADERRRLQKSFGYNYEEYRTSILTMAKNGSESIASMGIDTPLAALSDKHQPLFNYFKQRFAQVTNPPIDSIREEIVTSTTIYVGKNGNALYFSRSVIPFMRNKEKSEWLANHTYYKHIGLYAYRASVLEEITALPQSSLELTESLEQLRWLENGYKIKVGISEIETIGIDTPQDLARAEKFLQEQEMKR